MSLFTKLFKFKKKKNENTLTKTATFNGKEVIIKAPITQVKSSKYHGYFYMKPIFAKELKEKAEKEHYPNFEDNPLLSKPVKPSGF